jgi:hypothetical protein
MLHTAWIAVHIMAGIWHLPVAVLQVVPPVQVLPGQQAAPTVLHDGGVWHLLATQIWPPVQAVPPGMLHPPVVPPDDLQVPLVMSQVSEVLRHGIAPLQQGWLVPPHTAVHTFMLQLNPLLQVPEEQQPWPCPPQGLHMPITHVFPEVQGSLGGMQQALPASPQLPAGLSQTPFAQVSPLQQSFAL